MDDGSRHMNGFSQLHAGPGRKPGATWPGWTYFLLCDPLHQHGSYYYQDGLRRCNRIILRKESILGILGYITQLGC